LTQLLSKAVEVEVARIEVEYKDGYEEIYAVKGNLGYGFRLRSSSKEAFALRRELYSRVPKKGKKLNILGKEYLVKVKIVNSFGEDAFRVTVKSA
jgi:hypothetical protein